MTRPRLKDREDFYLERERPASSNARARHSREFKDVVFEDVVFDDNREMCQE